MKSKFKVIRNIFIGVFALLAILIGGAVYYVNNMLDKVESVSVNEENLGIDKEVDDKLSIEFGDVQNIALFGIDSKSMDEGRSDSIMLLTIDRNNKKIKLTSLMRDSYVSIPTRTGKDKLNHAYAFGGPELAIRTINENFGLNIKDFVTVNFESLPKIIDMLGGINLDINSEEIKYINKYIAGMNKMNKTNSPSITKPGICNVDGNQAVAYCRIRYTEGGDYKRTERHREVLSALFNKFKTLEVSNMPSLLDKTLPMIKTSLNSGEILKIASDGIKIGGNIEEERFPKDNSANGEMINEVYYLTFDEEQTRKDIHTWLFGE